MGAEWLGDYTCAVKISHTLWCWGTNGYGQFGTGNDVSSATPVQEATHARDWAVVTTGTLHTCAAKTSRTMWCWGVNTYGQLGIGDHTGQDLPHQVTTPAPGGWASVTAGYDHTCATRTGGTLWCWGSNGSGDLGIGSRTDQDRPQQVTGCAHPGTHSSPTRISRSITRRPARPYQANPGPLP